jgi:hypothetical protein
MRSCRQLRSCVDRLVNIEHVMPLVCAGNHEGVRMHVGAMYCMCNCIYAGLGTIRAYFQCTRPSHAELCVLRACYEVSLVAHVCRSAHGAAFSLHHNGCDHALCMSWQQDRCSNNSMLLAAARCSHGE